MPKRKEQEALPFENVDDYRREILERGIELADAIDPKFPDAERVSGAIDAVLETVKTFDLEGKWVTSCSGAELVTTREIRSVSIFPYLFKM